MHSHHICDLAVTAAFVVATTVANAGDRKTAEELPGVSLPAPIVEPAPEPIDQPRQSADGFVRMGIWDVKISGYTRVDVKSGKLHPDNR